MKILVTGANGFVGRALCQCLKDSGYEVYGAVRRLDVEDHLSVNSCIEVGEIDSETDWSRALDGVDTVIHLAARVHVMQELAKDPLEAFRRVNVQGTERLIRMAAHYKINRFIYVSSISVHGNSTGEKAYTENDEAKPHSPYAISKWEGELVARQIASQSGIELVVIRPPLVYGPGVGGNFLRLVNWSGKGLPLPLGSVHNKRSFIGVNNLADLLVTCVSSSNVAGETFLVADGEDLSTPDLVRRIGSLLCRPVNIIPFPISFMRMGSIFFRKEDMLDRLINSLRVDVSKTRRLLKWAPKITLDEGLRQTVEWYLSSSRKGDKK